MTATKEMSACQNDVAKYLAKATNAGNEVRYEYEKAPGWPGAARERSQAVFFCPAFTAPASSSSADGAENARKSE